MSAIRTFEGSVIQTKVAYSLPPLSTSSLFPADNTPPQITEGALALSLTITPKYQNSLFLVTASGTIGSSIASPSSVATAVFRNGVNSTIGSFMTVASTQAYVIGFCIQAPDLPNTLSELTYSLRFGGFAAGTAYLGRRDVLYFGSTQITTLTVQEIKQ